jgi:hypothetical protein
MKKIWSVDLSEKRVRMVREKAEFANLAGKRVGVV